MKTNVTLVKFLFLVCLIVSTKVFAQPDYSFKNPKLISGTALQAGAVYKYSNVKPGVDVIMTLGFISPGVTVAELDGASGYPEAIQPTLNLGPWTTGYLEMDLQWVNAGTTDPVVQSQIAVTCIDVDGIPDNDGQGHSVNEFDEINIGGGYSDFSTNGGELSVQQSGDWFIGTNIAGIDYPGRDTSAKAVMFSVINVNISSAIIRVGVKNESGNSASRLRSVYFKKFNYNNAILELKVPKPKVSKERIAPATSFKVYPSVIDGSAKMAVNAAKDGWAMFQLVDYSGRVLSQQQIVVDKGMNNVPLFNLSNVAKGSYLAVLKLDGGIYNQKIVKL